jgi:hypothetical protein
VKAVENIDLGGYQQVDSDVWRNPQGVIVSLHYFDLAPDMPAPLDDPVIFQNRIVQTINRPGMGLIELGLFNLDGIPAVWQLIKATLPQGHGQVFVGAITVPRANRSMVFKVQAAEMGTTGMREAMIMSQVGHDRFFHPSPFGVAPVEGALPTHAADQRQWDAQFPEHPLTLVRAQVGRILPTIKLAWDFKQQPPFTGPPS